MEYCRWFVKFSKVAMLGTVTACTASSQPTEALRLILNDPLTHPAPGDRCSDEVCTSLLNLIDHADQTVDFAIYGLRNQSQVLNALVAAKERGVRVRGVIDKDVAGQNYYDDSPTLEERLGTVHSDADVDRRSLADKKPFTGKPRCDRPAGFYGPLQCLAYDLGDQCLFAAQASRDPIAFKGDLMHNKTFVVDGHTVWTGSTNTSDSGTGGYNANLVAVVRSTEVAALYGKELEQLYSGRYHHHKESLGHPHLELDQGIWVDVLFSPKDRPIQYGVRKLLQNAEEQIDVAVFFLTHKGITQDLIDAHLRGVQVRVILDATAAKNAYSKHELLRASGIPVKVENWGGKMHMKSAVIDHKAVVAGSMNWTRAGESGNDENTLLIHSYRHAKQFDAFFEKLWQSIPDRWLEGRPDPESQDSTTACSDGVDNDFDQLADEQDPGCSNDPPPLPALPPYRIVAKQEGNHLIKGDVNANGEQRYYTPSHRLYGTVRVSPEDGDRWFCSTHLARAAGWRAASR